MLRHQPQAREARVVAVGGYPDNREIVPEVGSLLCQPASGDLRTRRIAGMIEASPQNRIDPFQIVLISEAL